MFGKKYVDNYLDSNNKNFLMKNHYKKITLRTKIATVDDYEIHLKRNPRSMFCQ